MSSVVVQVMPINVYDENQINKIIGIMEAHTIKDPHITRQRGSRCAYWALRSSLPRCVIVLAIILRKESLPISRYSIIARKVQMEIWPDSGIDIYHEMGNLQSVGHGWEFARN